MKLLLIAAGILSLVTMILYALDKLFAVMGAWRIPEKILLGLGFSCGGLGALLGMSIFRHKTLHWYFWAINAVGTGWQLAMLVFVYYKFFMV